MFFRKRFDQQILNSNEKLVLHERRVADFIFGSEGMTVKAFQVLSWKKEEARQRWPILDVMAAGQDKCNENFSQSERHRFISFVSINKGMQVKRPVNHRSQCENPRLAGKEET